MKFLIFAVTVVFALYNHGTEARTFTRCSLAQELAGLGVPRGDIATWVCIAQFESTFNTQAINRNNPDGSWTWGLFQLSDRWWCNPGDARQSNNACGVNCNQLIADDITAAVRCARSLQSSQGFGPWSAFNNNCSGGRSGSVADCGV